MKEIKAEILIYDRSNMDEWENLVHVCTPQECADMFGKPVKDGDVIYYPKDINEEDVKDEQ